MKKLVILFAFLFTAGLFAGCRYQKKCAAYNDINVDVEELAPVTD
jgi:hypothetical protein